MNTVCVFAIAVNVMSETENNQVQILQELLVSDSVRSPISKNNGRNIDKETVGAGLGICLRLND